jgi:hypothetical protein
VKEDGRSHTPPRHGPSFFHQGHNFHPGKRLREMIT